MDNPPRPSPVSLRRSSRRTTTSSPYARKPAPTPLPLARTSSIRSLFTLISSPFRSSASASNLAVDEQSPDRDPSEDERERDSDGFMSGEEDSFEDNVSIPSIQTSQTISNFRLAPPPAPFNNASPFSAQTPRTSLPASFPSTVTRSQTLSALSSGEPLGSLARSQKMLEKAVQGEGNGLSPVELDECRRLLHQSMSGPQSPHVPFAAATPLFHPGSSTQNGTPARQTATSLARSTSHLSFLSPSRVRPSPSSHSLSNPSSGPQSSGTPRRRPIYLGPGAGASPRRRPAVGRSFFGVDKKETDEPSAGTDSPGKRRRVDEGEKDEQEREEDEIIELALSGLGSASTSTPKKAAPLSSTPTSPFTFSVPFSPSAPTPQPSPSTHQPVRMRSLLSLSTKYKNPSLVAPSPLRQSTNFMDSPEGKKSNGADASPKMATKSARLMLDLIREETAKHESPSRSAPAPPTTPSTPSTRRSPKAQPAAPLAPLVGSPMPVPSASSTILNPYQSLGVVAPSPRRNPRRSIAATGRARAASSKTEKLPETPTGKRTRNDEPTPTPSPQPIENDSMMGSPPKEITPPEAPSPPTFNAEAMWANVQPPKVLFAHDLSMDSSMEGDLQDQTESPAKETLKVLRNLASPALSSSRTAPSSSLSSFGGSTKETPSKPKDAGPSLFSFGGTPSVPKPTPALSFRPTSPKPSPTPTQPSAPVYNGGKDAKTRAVETQSFLLPIYNFKFTANLSALPTTVEQRKALGEATNVPVGKLPNWDLLSVKKTTAPPPSIPSLSQGFNWAASGLKKAAVKQDEWTCPTCSISNPISGTKCLACEEPQPAAKASSASDSTPAPAVGGFNWAAAGMQKAVVKKDEWTCPTCSISNPLSGAKCLACEEPQPATASSTISPAPAPAPAVGGFNWAAAGMKPVQSAGWECTVCLVRNGEEKTKCVSCESDRS